MVVAGRRRETSPTVDDPWTRGADVAETRWQHGPTGYRHRCRCIVCVTEYAEQRSRSRPGRRPRPTPEERFWSRVAKIGLCWEWTGLKDRKGYGRFGVGGQETGAHRYAWTLMRGPVPEGLEIDHLCRNHGCVRPSHLEPVTRGENARRGLAGRVPRARSVRRDRCRAGHLFDEANTLMRANGYRTCRACSKIRRDRWRERQAS